jgi:hypothetical protein
MRYRIARTLTRDDGAEIPFGTIEGDELTALDLVVSSFRDNREPLDLPEMLTVGCDPNQCRYKTITITRIDEEQS